jgi:hypothetical protein
MADPVETASEIAAREEVTLFISKSPGQRRSQLAFATASSWQVGRIAHGSLRARGRKLGLPAQLRGKCEQMGDELFLEVARFVMRRTAARETARLEAVRVPRV